MRSPNDRRRERAGWLECRAKALARASSARERPPGVSLTYDLFLEASPAEVAGAAKAAFRLEGGDAELIDFRVGELAVQIAIVAPGAWTPSELGIEARSRVHFALDKFGDRDAQQRALLRGSIDLARLLDTGAALLFQHETIWFVDGAEGLVLNDELWDARRLGWIEVPYKLGKFSAH